MRAATEVTVWLFYVDFFLIGNLSKTHRAMPRHSRSGPKTYQIERSRSQNDGSTERSSQGHCSRREAELKPTPLTKHLFSGFRRLWAFHVCILKPRERWLSCFLANNIFIIITIYSCIEMKGNETQHETKCARPPAQSVFPFQILTYKYLRSLPLDCGWCSVQCRIFYGKQVCGGDVTRRAGKAERLVWAFLSLQTSSPLSPPEQDFLSEEVPTQR